jgi:hypothetical protein
MVKFEATTTPKSERLLANTLGYPESWHAVRKINSDDNDKETFDDTIYAGDPKSTPDIYYNHLAAMNAAAKWVDGESTPYDDNGGQMLPIDQTVKINAGDEVEVYYEPDSAWYAAVVKKVTEYKDDTRYSVKYKADRSTQDNIFVDIIRLIKPGKKKKKASTGGGKKTPAKKEDAADSTSATKGKKQTNSSTPKTNKRKNAKGGTSASKKKQKTKEKEVYIPDADGLHLAAEMGLPEGWTAFATSKSRLSFLSPDGTERFTSKKAVFDHIDKLDSSKIHSETKDPISASTIAPTAPVEGEDPPWRTDGHTFLQNRVKYEISSGEFITGTVTGWISADDVDKEGNPGFISEKDGEPAALYHVSFDSNAPIASQDLEEFELKHLFIDES